MSLRDFSPFCPFFENQRILVAGGSGFLGSCLVDCLTEIGAKVSSLSLQKKHPSADNILVDWENKEAVAQELADKNFDMVFNLGGYLNPSHDPKEEMKIINNHLRGTTHLVQCLNWNTIRLFFHLGSAEEYGLVPSPQREAGCCLPASPYGLAKLMATQYCLMRVTTTHLPIVVGRSNIVYGSKASTGLCHYVLSRALADQKIEVSLGLQKRDFIHIDDLLHGILTVAHGFLEEKIVAGEIFNIASGQERSVRELVELCCTLAEGGKPVFGALPYRPGESMEVFSDVEKIKSKLGWSATVSLSDGLRDIIQYLKGRK